MEMTDDSIDQGDYNVLTQDDADAEEDYEYAALTPPRHHARQNIGPDQPMSITPPKRTDSTAFLDTSP
jgi:hypothetical protein